MVARATFSAAVGSLTCACLQRTGPGLSSHLNDYRLSPSPSDYVSRFLIIRPMFIVDNQTGV